MKTTEIKTHYVVRLSLKTIETLDKFAPPSERERSRWIRGAIEDYLCKNHPRDYVKSRSHARKIGNDKARIYKQIGLVLNKQNLVLLKYQHPEVSITVVIEQAIIDKTKAIFQLLQPA